MKAKTWLLVMMSGLMLHTLAVKASGAEKIVRAETKADFAAVTNEVQKQLQPGGRFEFTTAKERSDINANLGDMQALFDKFGTVSAMDQSSKLKLFNDQEALNATLTRRDDKRLVCENVAPIGSNIPRTKCRTYGQIERDQHDTQHFLNQTSQVQSLVGGNNQKLGH